MKIIIFGGTTEGRTLAQRLAALGASITVSVATPLGAQELAETKSLTISCGRKNQEEMKALLAGFDLCIDATHPYATEVSANLKAVCAVLGLSLRRLLRPCVKADGVISVKSCREAAELLSETKGNILLTTGAKELSEFARLSGSRLFARVLPTCEGIFACKAIDLASKNILALQGPFTVKMNEAMLEQYHIEWLVTKDGGAAGGFPEKLLAARNTGVTAIVIDRPVESGETEDEIYESIREALQ